MPICSRTTFIANSSSSSNSKLFSLSLYTRKIFYLMASLVLLLSEFVRLQNPNSAILKKLLPAGVAATSMPMPMPMPSVQKDQYPSSNQQPVEEDVQDLRVCIDDQVWP